jgi:hypothetical protein
MNLTELQERHPAIYKAAKAEGAERERHRTSSHIIMGEKSGDLKTALASIRNGADLTIEIQAQYMSAAINREDIRLHQSESDEAEAVVEGAKTPTGGYRDAHGEAVLDRLEVLLGVGEAGERNIEGIE